MDGFDLDRYLRNSKRVDLSGVHWDRVGDDPLSEDEARCLAYMMDIESRPGCGSGLRISSCCPTPAATHSPAEHPQRLGRTSVPPAVSMTSSPIACSRSRSKSLRA